MSDDPASVIAQHRAQMGLLFHGRLLCQCGGEFPDAVAWGGHVADALQLQHERGVKFKYTEQVIALKGDQKYSDYGSNWEQLWRSVTPWNRVGGNQ